VVRSDQRDRRTVFFQDPADLAEWYVLRWNGLPPEGEIPAFSDRTAEELLDEARASGLSPLSDADLPSAGRNLSPAEDGTRCRTAAGPGSTRPPVPGGRPVPG